MKAMLNTTPSVLRLTTMRDMVEGDIGHIEDSSSGYDGSLVVKTFPNFLVRLSDEGIRRGMYGGKYWNNNTTLVRLLDEGSALSLRQDR